MKCTVIVIFNQNGDTLLSYLSACLFATYLFPAFKLQGVFKHAYIYK